jgi:hypothetical protein
VGVAGPEAEAGELLAETMIGTKSYRQKRFGRWSVRSERLDADYIQVLKI